MLYSFFWAENHMPKLCLTANLDSWGNCGSGFSTWTSNFNWIWEVVLKRTVLEESVLILVVVVNWMGEVRRGGCRSSGEVKKGTCFGCSYFEAFQKRSYKYLKVSAPRTWEAAALLWSPVPGFCLSGKHPWLFKCVFWTCWETCSSFAEKISKLVTVIHDAACTAYADITSILESFVDQYSLREDGSY